MDHVLVNVSYFQLFATPWTVACQAPLAWNSSGKNTGASSHSLLQIFPTQGLNPYRKFPALAGFPLSGPVEKSTVVSHLLFLPKNLTVNLT